MAFLPEMNGFRSFAPEIPPPSHYPNMQSSPLADDDVRSMVKLLGDIAGMNDSLENKRRALVEGLARLIDADAWYWAILANGTPGERPTFSVYLKQGFGEARFARYLRALEHPEMKGFNEPFFAEFARNGHHITRLYQQIDPEGRFPRSDAAIGWREAKLPHPTPSATYLKEIYSRFNVGSQASLISRFYQGDGGDTP